LHLNFYLLNAEIAGARALMTLIASFAGWTKYGRICAYEGIVIPFASAAVAAGGAASGVEENELDIYRLVIY
jgi:hypothetical protein